MSADMYCTCGRTGCIQCDTGPAPESARMLALAAIAAADRASGRAHRSLSATVTDAQLEAVLTRLETGVEVSPLEAARNDYETVLQDMAGRDHE